MWLGPGTIILGPMNNQTKIARSRILVGTMLAVLIALAGCGGGDQTAEQQKPGGNAADATPNTQHDEPHTPASGGTTLAGVTFVSLEGIQTLVDTAVELLEQLWEEDGR